MNFKELKKLTDLESVRYIFIGFCTTAVNFIFFALFYNLLNINLNISNFIAISLSIIFAFFANKTIVFSFKSDSLKQTVYEFIKFISGRIFTMIVEIVGVWLMVEQLSLNEYTSKLTVQIIVLILNYVISKFFVFTVKKKT